MMPPGFERLFYKALKQPAYAVIVGMKRLISRVYYALGRGAAPSPESITFFLTRRCNLQCKMCGQWGDAGITRKQSAETIREELPIRALKSVVDNISSFSPSITLFGGEPLLYSGCIDLIKHIKSKKMHCLVITNALLLEPLAAELVASGLDELNVSLDGPRDVHDDIRGMPGLFDRIMAGLQLIKQIKTSTGRKKPLVNIQCTITKHNYHSLEEMPAVASLAGADSITFHNLIFTNYEVMARQKLFDDTLGCSSADWKGFDFDHDIDPEALGAKMERIASGRYDFNIDFYPNFSRAELIRYYKEASFIPSEYPARCLSPWIAAYIFPDGDVRPCLNSSYSYGNIQLEPFLGVWNSPAALKYRRMLKDSRIFPVCARCTELYRY